MRVGVPKEIKNNEYRVGLTRADKPTGLANGLARRGAGCADG